jgi:hypothetical protein
MTQNNMVMFLGTPYPPIYWSNSWLYFTVTDRPSLVLVLAPLFVQALFILNNLNCITVLYNNWLLDNCFIGAGCIKGV